jgi:progranulin
MRLIKSTCFLYGAAFLTSAAGSASTVNNASYVNDQQDGQQNPMVVRKMSDDEGEKFFFNYWGIDTSEEYSFLSSRANVSDLRPPILLHTETDADSILLAEKYSASKRALSMLWRRDFQCPTDTYSCSSIGQSDSCCEDSDTCVIVQNTGLGVVGCCPAGETCGDTVGSCAEGYSSCASSLGGGCCIPGYKCVTGGC